jgi:GTP cyclohydrolase I
MNEDEAPSVLSQLTSEELFREFLRSLGVDVERDGLANTPARVVRMYREMLRPPEFVATSFENDGEYDSLVTVRDIPFYSLCEHHLLPFFGVAHVGYLPEGRVLGLSKLAWIVEKHARALQVQERMTTQIADDVSAAMNPRAVGVVIDARHLCMEARGVKKVGSTTRTTVLRGDLLTNKSLKEEFMTALQR